jgi:tRNA pseudouridine55 synthase
MPPARESCHWDTPIAKSAPMTSPFASRESSVPNGIVVVDKPPGVTSHDVVQRVRRAVGSRAVGHAGTLDPMATGVLVVAVGQATKLVPWLTAADKSYEATIRLGSQTDTLDADGTLTATKSVGEPVLLALAAWRSNKVAPLLDEVLSEERRRTFQLPPKHSAIRTEGRRAYALARSGQPVELAPRPVRIAEIRLVGCSDDPPTLSVALVVSKGYYVRAFARDVAEALGTVGHLTSLRRVGSGLYTIAEAVAPDAPDLSSRIEPLADAACRVLPVARLTRAGATDARNGRPVQRHDIEGAGTGPTAWLDEQGELVAVGEMGPEGHGRVVRGFSTVR